MALPVILGLHALPVLLAPPAPPPVDAPRALLRTAGRALVIAAGVTLAGERDPTKVARYTLGATLALAVGEALWP